MLLLISLPVLDCFCYNYWESTLVTVLLYIVIFKNELFMCTAKLLETTYSWCVVLCYCWRSRSGLFLRRSGIISMCARPAPRVAIGLSRGSFLHWLPGLPCFALCAIQAAQTTSAEVFLVPMTTRGAMSMSSLSLIKVSYGVVPALLSVYVWPYILVIWCSVYVMVCSSPAAVYTHGRWW